MNIYYKVTKVDSRGIIYYELEVPFRSYYISIYFTTSHLPHKRLAKYRPLSYFMIFSDVLEIIVSLKDRILMAPNYEVDIEKPNRETLKLLIKKVGISISGVGIRDIKPGDIVNEFLKAL